LGIVGLGIAESVPVGSAHEANRPRMTKTRVNIKKMFLFFITNSFISKNDRGHNYDL
jgi:hypothetical protein